MNVEETAIYILPTVGCGIITEALVAEINLLNSDIWQTSTLKSNSFPVEMLLRVNY